MILQRNNVWGKVISASDAERALVSEFLTYERQGGKRTWDKSLQTIDHSFRAGLIPLLRLKAKQQGYTVEELDQRNVVSPRPDWKEWIEASWLRSDQKDALRSVLRNVYGLWKCVTSWGKGDLAVALFGVYPTTRCLMVVPNKDLLDDTVERVSKYLKEPCGKIGDSHWSIGRITVATYQTLYSRFQTPECQALLGTVEVLVCDEVHSSAASTCYDVIQATERAYVRVGLSATPLDRGDDGNFLVLSNFGPIRYEAAPESVIEAGIVTKPVVHLYPCFQQSLRPWPACYQELVVRSEKRNNLIIELAKRKPKPCLISISDIPHGMALTRWLKETGLRSEFIYGETPTEVRKAAVGRLATGMTEVLVASVIMNQGQLSPLIREIRSIINAASGLSHIRTVQRVGRGMRKALGKDVLDFSDLSDDGHPILRQHALARMSYYIGCGYEVIKEEAPLFGGRQLAF